MGKLLLKTMYIRLDVWVNTHASKKTMRVMNELNRVNLETKYYAHSTRRG
ncbi:hypothetical protein PAUR_b0096 [Pseudoalteromonas aurantia 208]|uniref:Integrase n=1 Tax=Pseudoalteromonas aurantia 208 TaxID=1314867 RepID=A0ABR9EGS1_9GAMM|nr:hypothetical protein [Pseudoalteromonas aurantia 208]